VEAACGRAGIGLPVKGGIEGGRRGAGRGGVSTRDRIHPEQIQRGHSHEYGKLSPLFALGFVGVCTNRLTFAVIDRVL